MSAAGGIARLTLQIWDPTSGRVVRTIARGVRLVLASSPTQVLWEADSQRLYLADLATGRTDRVAVPIPEGYLAWGGPVLASSGPLVAMLMVTPTTKRMIEPPAGPGGRRCKGYSVPGSGLLVLYDVATGHLVMTRAVPLSRWQISSGRLTTPSSC